ncbi:hypothetical protein B0H13DRAFT_2312185 [Mycena leptocephala]|nr:hypothetical protein B0H13DRAFT_2312185 [Mycena leptocephala]
MPRAAHPPNVPTTRRSAPEGLGSVIRDAIQSVKELSATAFIGYGVSTVAYGISIVQVYLYFRNYPKDTIFLKLTVAALWTLDTLSSIVNSHALYTLYVLNFNNLFADAHIPWSLPVSRTFSVYYLFQGLISVVFPQLGSAILTTTNTISLIFYGWQIWSVSRNFVVVGVILSLALVSCGVYTISTSCRLIQVPCAPFSGRTLYVPFSPLPSTGVLPLPPQTPLFLTAIYADLSVYLFRFPTIVSLLGHTSRSMSTIIESTQLVCDITITTSLIYYLRSRKAGGVRSTQDMIAELIMHAMSRGILTAVCIAMLFILDVPFPNHFYWVPFYQLLGKLYVNSILASLNVRTSVRGKGQLEVSTHSAFRIMEFASGPSSTPHSDSNTADSGADGRKEFQVQLGADTTYRISY